MAAGQTPGDIGEFRGIGGKKQAVGRCPHQILASALHQIARRAGGKADCAIAADFKQEVGVGKGKAQKAGTDGHKQLPDARAMSLRSP